jgi:hypothetical protein
VAVTEVRERLAVKGSKPKQCRSSKLSHMKPADISEEKRKQYLKGRIDELENIGDLFRGISYLKVTSLEII